MVPASYGNFPHSDSGEILLAGSMVSAALPVDVVGVVVVSTVGPVGVDLTIAAAAAVVVVVGCAFLRSKVAVDACVAGGTMIFDTQWSPELELELPEHSPDPSAGSFRLW